MGGIGKTTLASALFNELLTEEWEAVCFLDSVRSRDAQPGQRVAMQLELVQALTDDAVLEVRSEQEGAH